MEKKILPLYEMIVDDETSGVFAISLVDNPAMEDEFILFNDLINTNDLVFSSIDDDEQMIIGLIMEPNKRIYRKNKDGYEYEVMASKEIVKKSAHYFLMNNNQNNITLQHEIPVDDISVVETWIVRDSERDLSNFYGKKYPIGSWVGIMKINDPNKWESFKNDGRINGFSIEGRFKLNEIIETEMSEEVKLDEDELEIVNEVLENLLVEIKKKYNNKK